MSKKHSVAESVAADMAGIMESDEYRAVFSKPQPPAPSVEETNSEETPVVQAKNKTERLKLAVQGVAKISEVLDELGFATSATMALQTLEQIVREAEAYMDDDSDSSDADDSLDAKDKKSKDKDEDKEDKDEDDKEEKEEKDEEDEDDAEDAAKGKPAAPPKKTAPPEYFNKVPNPHFKDPPPESKPQSKPKSRGGETFKFEEGDPNSADDTDSNVHGAHDSAIDVGIKDDSGMADDGNAVDDDSEVIAAGSDETLTDLLSALGLEVTAAAKKDDKERAKAKAEKEKAKAKADKEKAKAKAEKEKAKAKADKEKEKAKAEKAKMKKKAWVASDSGELIVQALEYADYDVEDITEEIAEQFDVLREAARYSSNSTIIALAKKEKVKNSFVFPSTHPKVKSGDHFPIDTEGRARNALARANQFSKAPSWWNGSLQDLVSTVASAVSRKYKGIEVSDKSKKPGRD